MTERATPELISVHDAASLLGCSLRTLQRHRNEGRIEFIRRGREKFCVREEVELLAGGDRTEVIAARLLAPECDAMLANEWFRRWAEFWARSARPSRIRIDCAPLLAEIERRFGLARMRDVTVGDLLGVLEAIEASGALFCEPLLDLSAMQLVPRDLAMLDGRRQLFHALSGRRIGGDPTAAPWRGGWPAQRTHRPYERGVARMNAG